MLLALGLLLAAGGVGHGETTLRVDVSESEVAVDVKDASVVDVLQELGARAGFEVVHVRPVETKVTIAVRAATIDEVLKQVLRNENYTVVYRGSADGRAGITKVLLLGGVSPRSTPVEVPAPIPPMASLEVGSGERGEAGHLGPASRPGCRRAAWPTRRHRQC